MNLMNFPIIIFVLSVAVLSLASRLGSRQRLRHPLPEEERDDFGIVLSATLTLLGLLIGFTFSMAVSRYDQRKLYEEAEANAIGTEYVRADLLPAADGAKVRDLLKSYLDQRLLFYTIRSPWKLAKINADTAELQNELWSAVRQQAAAQPTPITALVVSGMNDVLNSQGYTQSAWWNRIPVAAWILMATIAIGCNVLIGYGARWTDWRSALDRTARRIFVVLPDFRHRQPSWRRHSRRSAKPVKPLAFACSALISMPLPECAEFASVRFRQRKINLEAGIARL